MATIGDVVTTVHSDYFHRTDLTALITKQAVRVYQTICNKIPFEALQTTSAAIPCVVGQTAYDLATLDPVLAGICSIRITYTSGVGGLAARLQRDHSRTFDSMQAIANSKPRKYARWAKKIELWPPPDSASYTMAIRYWASADIDATPANTVIACPDEWVELIEWETYYRSLTVLGRAQEAAMLVQPSMMPKGASVKRTIQSDIGIIPRLWNELLQTIQQREHVDEEFGMQPIIRS